MWAAHQKRIPADWDYSKGGQRRASETAAQCLASYPRRAHAWKWRRDRVRTARTQIESGDATDFELRTLQSRLVAASPATGYNRPAISAARPLCPLPPQHPRRHSQILPAQTAAVPALVWPQTRSWRKRRIEAVSRCRRGLQI